MISGIVFIVITIFFLIYFLVSESQSMIELRSIIKNSIFTNRIVHLFPAATGFSNQPKPKGKNLDPCFHFYPQASGDFIDTFRAKEADILFLEAPGFRASESDFIKKPFMKEKEMPKKEKGTLPKSQWNPPLTSFDYTYRFIPPALPEYPEDTDKSKRTQLLIETKPNDLTKTATDSNVNDEQAQKKTTKERPAPLDVS